MPVPEFCGCQVPRGSTTLPFFFFRDKILKLIRFTTVKGCICLSLFLFVSPGLSLVGKKDTNMAGSIPGFLDVKIYNAVIKMLLSERRNMPAIEFPLTSSWNILFFVRSFLSRAQRSLERSDRFIFSDLSEPPLSWRNNNVCCTA